MRLPILIAALIVTLYSAESYAAKAMPAPQATDIIATVVCGKSEQPTPCMLILNKSVPTYELTVKNGDRALCTIKVELVKGVWQVLGESRLEALTEVVVDASDGSCTVFNPRRPDLARELVPKGCTGLLIRTVEVRK